MSAKRIIELPDANTIKPLVGDDLLVLDVERGGSRVTVKCRLADAFAGLSPTPQIDTAIYNGGTHYVELTGSGFMPYATAVLGGTTNGTVKWVDFTSMVIDFGTLEPGVYNVVVTNLFSSDNQDMEV